jgi:ABC-type antimicrobial peptide transport system permease subunit
MPQRLLATLSTVFGGLALALAAVGLYGVVAFEAGRRSKEIGIRLALGAGRQQVRAMILLETVVIAGAGILIGFPIAIGTARLLAGLVDGIERQDPIMLGSTIALLLGVATAAGYVPAYRASRIEPAFMLRNE